MRRFVPVFTSPAFYGGIAGFFLASAIFNPTVITWVAAVVWAGNAAFAERTR